MMHGVDMGEVEGEEIGMMHEVGMGEVMGDFTYVCVQERVYSRMC